MHVVTQATRTGVVTWDHPNLNCPGEIWGEMHTFEEMVSNCRGVIPIPVLASLVDPRAVRLDV